MLQLRYYLRIRYRKFGNIGAPRIYALVHCAHISFLDVSPVSTVFQRTRMRNSTQSLLRVRVMQLYLCAKRPLLCETWRMRRRMETCVVFIRLMWFGGGSGGGEDVCQSTCAQVCCKKWALVLERWGLIRSCVCVSVCVCSYAHATSLCNRAIMCVVESLMLVQLLLLLMHAFTQPDRMQTTNVCNPTFTGLY